MSFTDQVVVVLKYFLFKYDWLVIKLPHTACGNFNHLKL